MSPEDDGRRRQRKQKRPDLDALLEAVRASQPAFDRIARLAGGLATYRHIAVLLKVDQGCSTTELIADALSVPSDELAPVIAEMLAAGVLTEEEAGYSLSPLVSMEEEPEKVTVKFEPPEGCSMALSVPRHLLDPE